MIVPSETPRDEKDERRVYDRRKDIDTVRSARNAKNATPDAIMRRCFRFGVRSKGSRTSQSAARSAIAKSRFLPMYNLRDNRDRVLSLLSLYFDTS